jgi:DNA-binding PadR family transcriptional regulator
MGSKRQVSNPLGLAVLSYLVQRPMHPYELSRTLREHGDARSIRYNHGSLYTVVGQLARAGFITAQETTRQGLRPERTVYALTDAGRRELHDWLHELIATPEHEYPQFVAALSLISALPPDEVVTLLGDRLRGIDAQRVQARGLIDGTLADGVHPLFLVEEEYRLAQFDAEYAFIERLIARITDPDGGWGKPWAEFHRSSPPRPPGSVAAD